MVKQNKTNFIMDNYIELNNPFAVRDIVKQLIDSSIAFAVEPWPDDHWRIYVKKDAKGLLGTLT